MPSARSTPSARTRGRSRDPAIDARVLAAAARQLATNGYDAMSVSAIAYEARTTRQAIYRRWPTKASLAAAALALAIDATAPSGAKPDAGPLGALIAELKNFERGVSRPGRLSLVGTMLQDSTDQDVRGRYRAEVVGPRRARIRRILDDARAGGWIDADADLEIAVTLCTGSWYAAALAQDAPPHDWAARVATLVWRSIGGSTSPAATTRERPGIHR